MGIFDTITNTARQIGGGIGDAASSVGSAIDRVASSAGGVVNARLSSLKNALGGNFGSITSQLTSSRSRAATSIGFNSSGASYESDWRVKISISEEADYFYQNYDSGVMAPLFGGSSDVNGVIFPYTPAVQVQHVARYGNQKLTHSNYDAYFYEGSEVQAITVSGDFTAHNPSEAAYVLASIYFFRACTKMWFGQDQRAGNPPPMVFLDGYGKYYFPHVPCVITGFNHSMPADVDYIEAPGAEGTTRIPTQSTLSVTLQPVYSRRRASEFSLDDFAAGRMIDKGFL